MDIVSINQLDVLRLKITIDNFNFIVYNVITIKQGGKQNERTYMERTL